MSTVVLVVFEVGASVVVMVVVGSVDFVGRTSLSVVDVGVIVVAWVLVMVMGAFVS